MGQQQLLLIILGVIIVGIAVAVGISMFTASATSANRDAVSSDLTNLASMAQQHYRRPGAMGGGNNSFDGSGGGQSWVIAAQLDTTANGFYAATVSADQVVIVGTGREIGNDGINPVELTCTVTPTAISSVSNN
jgi:Tfp pilus assembly protein PilE